MAKKTKIKDPYEKREAETYANPIASREFILQYLSDLGRPARVEHLLEALQIKTEEQVEALRRRLNAMVRDGQLMRNRRGSFALVDKMDLLRGRVIGHCEGYGFVELDEGGDDLFLSAKQMQHVFDGDRVLVRVISSERRGKREAAIVEVLERVANQLVGRLTFAGGFSFVIPDNKRIARDIIIPSEHLNGATEGQMVVVELTIPLNYRHQAVGKIIEILGIPMAPGLEIEIAIRSFGIPYNWPSDVTEECKKFAKTVPASAKKNRVDLRSLPLVTIDGEDAKDFDDAVYCEKDATGSWRLIVAIADVSHYVTPGMALDQEAAKRGNSVYFPERVIPMLPELLSNGLCSLNPKVDRLCMVCDMTISRQGKLESYQFYKAVMQSKARLTYTQVAELTNVGRSDIIDAALWPLLFELHRLFKVLYKKRNARGSIDFDFPEPKIIFDRARKIEKIIAVSRNDAHRIIEECMLLANQCAADFITQAELPCPYRIHAGPNSDKLNDLQTFLRELGLTLGGGDEPEPIHFANLLKKIKNRDDAILIETVLLRSLSQAVYSIDNIGHFGLAFPAYTHFTSPIRRYPDLLVHRLIEHIINKMPAKKFIYTPSQMAEMAAHSSMTERRADEATREAIDWLKCEFMQDKLGKVYQGKISSVTAFGIFVELHEFYVDGLVHITALKNDYYHFDRIRHLLVGERTRTLYRLGDEITVRVVRVDLDECKIDFELVYDEKEDVRTSSKPSKKKESRKKKNSKTKPFKRKKPKR